MGGVKKMTKNRVIKKKRMEHREACAIYNIIPHALFQSFLLSQAGGIRNRDVELKLCTRNVYVHFYRW